MRKQFLFSLLSGLGLLLAGCQGAPAPVSAPPSQPPPVPVVTPPSPAPPSPPSTDGFWHGQTAAGPWCSDKTSRLRGASAAAQDVVELRREVSPQMQALRGLRGVAAGEPQVVMALLPTGEAPDAAYRALRASARPQVTLLDNFGAWVRLRATAAQLQQLLEQRLIQYAEPEQVWHPQGLQVPADANLPRQNTYFKLTGLDRTWPQLELGCRHPVVAVIDSGWQGSTVGHRLNLVSPNSWYNAVTQTQGNADALVPGFTHGTEVAAVLTMVSNDASPGSGVANNLVKVLPISAMRSDGQLHGADVARAIEYALGSALNSTGQVVINPYPAQVINMSFAEAAGGELSAFLTSYLERVAARGVVSVAAVGNEGASGVSDLAQHPLVIGVGGVNSRGEWWQDSATVGSNYGSGVSVAGPAERVPVLLNGLPEQVSGTSMAAPWVAGQIALWMYANQQYRADGSMTNGLTGAALYTFLTGCLQATGSHDGIWREKGGFGVPDTARMVSPATGACRS